MKLRSLWLQEWKNLREFEVTFDDAPVTTIVGRNGTGKSNLLEALVAIFRDLDLGQPPTMSFRLAYQCREHLVEVEGDHLKGQVIATVDGTALRGTKSALKRDKEGNSPYLPAHVFGYYSGLSQRMEELFDRHQKNFYDDLLYKKETPKVKAETAKMRWLRPLFYARQEHSQFVLLAFLLDLEGAGGAFLRDYLNIEAFDSALFVFRKPSAWDKKTGGDDRFWHATGAVRPLLARLFDLSLAPLRRDDPVKISFRQTLGREHLYLYLPELKDLLSLSAGYESPQEFFKALESTFISDLIKEVRIRVRIREMDGSITFRELSEGEQQLLTVLGLLLFTEEEESLFLLDEPDTHLNPQWSIGYIELLQKVAGPGDNSHVLLTTHNPLVVSSLERKQVQILKWDEAKKKNISEMPDVDPRGMGIAALLTSDLFGLRAALDLPTLDLLDEKRALAVKEHLTAKEKQRLDELNEELGALDFTTTMRDPLYQLFVKEMSRYEIEEGLRGPVLTSEQQEARVQHALEVVRRLMIEEKAKQEVAA